MENIKKYILDYSRENFGSDLDDKALFKVDYLGESLIDSLQFIEMISDFEKKFGVRFSSKDLSSGSLRTLREIETAINRLNKRRKKK